MHEAYIIETKRGAAGIVVRDGRRYRFFAATRAFAGLEGCIFDTPRQAETAAIRCADDRESTAAATIRPPGLCSALDSLMSLRSRSADPHGDNDRTDPG